VPARAQQQLDAEPGLDAANGFGQRRLGDGQTRGGAAEVQFLGERDEVLKLPRLQTNHAFRLSPENQSILDFGGERRFDEAMLNHTMIVSFTDPVPDIELDQFLREMEQVMRDAGHLQSFAARRHIRVPADEHSPVFVATAIVRFGVADLDALNASFAAPGVEELIGRWQSRYAYQVVWANHEPLS
jgi:hypothetical protein